MKGDHQADQVHHEPQVNRYLERSHYPIPPPFQEQLRLLDSPVSPSKNLPHFIRLIFLQQAVEAIPDLRRVRIVDSLMRTKGAVTASLTYSSYYELVIVAAFHHDRALVDHTT